MARDFLFITDVYLVLRVDAVIMKEFWNLKKYSCVIF